MDLIDRYVHDVGRRLPKNTRTDIEKELRSLIEDALEARTGGKEPGEEDIIAVLKEFGSPHEMAAKYPGAARRLIGPRLLTPYWTIVGVVVGISAVAVIINFLVSAYNAEGLGILPKIGEIFSNFINGAAAGIGFVTMIFALIDRLAPKDGKASAWDPRKLPHLRPVRESAKRGEFIAGACFTVLALLLLNLFPAQVGVYTTPTAGQAWTFMPVLDPATLSRYVVLWDISLGLTLAFNIAMIVRGRWEHATRLADTGLSLLSIAILAVMLAGPPLISADFIAAHYTGPSSEGMPILFGMVESGVKIALIVLLVLTVIAAGVKIFRAVRYHSPRTPKAG